jgi:galactokinase
MTELIKKVYTEFKELFKEKPILIESPGRVNLIGEHTDYNDGFVLPATIQKKIILGISGNNSNTIRAYSIDMNEYAEIDATSLDEHKYQWANYIKGISSELQKDGHQIHGFDVVFSGDIPIGAGMSSSAALEGGLLTGLNKLMDLGLSKEKMSKIGQLTEHHHIGVNCGIMDQFVNLHGKANHVLRLDCRSLDYSLYPFEREDLMIVLCNTMVSHNLADSEYNTRRKQCEQGVAVLQRYSPEIKNLRDVSMDQLEAHKDEMDAVVYRRCKFVLEENQRVLDACTDLENDHFEAFGQRMFESHQGLRHEYEVSCQELDLLVDIAREQPGVYGSRMMGGGFGGCTINLVQKGDVDSFKEVIKREYLSQTGITTEIYCTQIGSGAHVPDSNYSEV